VQVTIASVEFITRQFKYVRRDMAKLVRGVKTRHKIIQMNTKGESVVNRIYLDLCSRNLPFVLGNITEGRLATLHYYGRRISF
jgi:hypothetical protein